MQKFKDQKSCSCRACRFGSKRHEKKASHKAFRHGQRLTTSAYMTGQSEDFEHGGHGAGYWD